MPTLESIKLDINSLGDSNKEQILTYLEEVIIIGCSMSNCNIKIKDF